MKTARGGSGIPMRSELWRKALHLLSLLVPVGVLYHGSRTALLYLIPLATVAIAIEVLRARSGWVRDLVERVFGFMMRPEELPPVPAPIRFNGATWVLLTAAVLVALFSSTVAAAAISIGLVGDAAAALFGRKFGRTTIGSTDKTFEGSFAFVLCTVPLIWIVPGLTPLAAALGIVSGAVFEAFHLPIDDNFTVPMAAAVAMTLVM